MTNEYNMLVKLTKKMELDSWQEINVETEISWEFFWKLCVYHKVIGFIFPKLEFLKMSMPQDILNKWKEWRKKTLNTNCLQREAYSELLAHIDFPVILLKGAWLTDFLYGRDDIRSSLDVDILFDIKNKQSLTTELEKLGYVQGNFDKDKCSIIDASREDILYKELYTHELLPFIKIENTIPVCIDCNFKFSWCGSKQYKAPGAEFSYYLKYSKTYENDRLRCISFIPELFFIHLCVHFYNEYHFFMFDEYVECGHLRLYQICDIRLFVCKFHLNKQLVSELATEIKTQRQLHFCASISRSIYADDVLDEYLDLNEGMDINVYVDKQGEVQNWPIGIKERILKLPSL